MDHRSRHWIFRTDWVRHNRPNIRMSLQQKRHALDRGGVRAFTALRKAFTDQAGRIREERDLPAVFTIAAKIILQPFAVRRLCEHARECKFSYASRPGEK